MSTTHHSHKNSDDSLVTTSECKESSALSLTNTLTSDDSPNVTTPKLLTPRDVQKRTRRLLDANTKSTVTFLEKSKRATQFIYSGSQAMKHVLRKSLLVKINQQYGLAGNVKRNLSKSTNNNFPVNQVTTKVIEETQEIYKEKIFQMNIYFSELSSKKLLGMYDLFVGSLTTEPLTDTVDYAYNDSKLKQKKCTLHSNFLIISSIKSQHKEVGYLHNPVVSKIDPFGITLNSSHTLIFENEERQKQWLEAIDKLSIWVESIPRTIMDQETPNGKITQPNITNAPRRVRTPTPPLTTPRKSIEKEQKKVLKSISFLSKKDKHDKHDKHPKENRVKLFGIKLEEYAILNQTTSLPEPITLLINFLKENGANKEGIFRICGSQDTIQSVKNKLELGDMSVLQTVDIHSLASTLKQYIREFPSQVVPPEIDRDFIQLYKGLYLNVLYLFIAKQTLSEEEVLSNYISIIKTLPPIIYEFVKV